MDILSDQTAAYRGRNLIHQTAEGMAQAWPTMGGNPFGDHVNSITKYVVASQPVDTTAWDPTVVIAGPDLLDEVSRLKQAEGGDLLIWGTGQLTDALAAAGLLDEYRICTSPIIKGGGEPLFRPASTGTVELLDTKIFATGAVVHAYRPTSAPGPEPSRPTRARHELAVTEERGFIGPLASTTAIEAFVR